MWHNRGMGKRKFQLTPEQINELQGAYQQCDDGATKIRYQAVRLYGSGYAAEEVIEITGCSRRRLLAWCRSYREYGVAGLIDRRAGGNSAKLRAVKWKQYKTNCTSIVPISCLVPMRTAAMANSGGCANWRCCWNETYGVVYQSKTSYRNLLKRCGLSRQRPAAAVQITQRGESHGL